MSTYEALFENGSAARLQQEASAAPPRVPEGYNRPRRLYQSAPCNRQAQTFASIFRLDWRSTELASGWGELPVGTRARYEEAPVGGLV
jgi:hypothetical protein